MSDIDTAAAAAYVAMYTELTGHPPKTPFAECDTVTQNSWRAVAEAARKASDAPSLPIGYNPHKLGDYTCPINPETWCKVVLGEDYFPSPGWPAQAKYWSWGSVTGYMIVPPPADAEPAKPKLPEGYLPHTPGDPCPIPPTTQCYAFFRSGEGSEKPHLAEYWSWGDDVAWTIIGYKVVEQPKAEWPWKPKFGEAYWLASAYHEVYQVNWTDDAADSSYLATGNVYRTREEALARAELEKRMSLTARLRELGGGDEGEWVVRWSTWNNCWAVWKVDIGVAPGEARFQTREAAQSALDTIRKAGLLPESWS